MGFIRTLVQAVEGVTRYATETLCADPGNLMQLAFKNAVEVGLARFIALSGVAETGSAATQGIPAMPSFDRPAMIYSAA
jgi:hypothetical protein